MGKSDCQQCGKSANRVASNKSGSLQCNVCSLWYHPPCVKMEESTLELIHKLVEAGLPSPWVCTVCESGLAKVAKDVKLNTARIGNVEKRTDGLESEVEKLKAENVSMKKEVEALKDLVGKTQERVSENSGDQILEEMAERGSRERNVVCHKCPESSFSVPEDAKMSDMEGTQGLFDHLGLPFKASEVLIGLRRLGKATGIAEQPRPLLLIFKNKADRDMLLQRTPRLSKDNEEYWTRINVVPDLTQRQRKLEQDMFKKAEAKNLGRSADESSKNLCWKILGKKGERVMRQLEMRQDEVINGEGKVVPRGQGEREKRPHSPGNSPPAKRGERFGRRE